MKYKGVIESALVRKLERQKIYRNATRSATRPYDLSKIKSLQVNGRLELDVFYENIGGIWPFIIQMISEGMSLQAIGRLIGFKSRTLQTMLTRIPKLREHISEARTLRSDDRTIRKIIL